MTNNVRMGNVIGRAEGGYNSFNRGKAGDSVGQKLDLTEMTVAEIRALQALPRNDPNWLFAVGKYQIVKDTMTSLFDDSLKGYDQTQKFTPEVQEELFQGLLSLSWRSPMKNYITGKSNDLDAAALSASKEWASIENPKKEGEMLSFYEGTGGNKAHISVKKIQAALNVERAIYQEKIKEGLSPEAAFSALNLAPKPIDPILEADQEITTKLDHIHELNDQYKDYDRDSAGIGKVAIANQIHEEQVAIAQLELDKSDYINSEQAKLLAEKAPHETAIQNADTILGALKAQALLSPTEITGAPTLQTAMEAQRAEATTALANISEKYNQLEAQKPSVIDQQIAAQTANIAKLNADITNYDKNSIDPLKEIQQQLTEHTQNNADNSGTDSTTDTATSAYQAVEKELKDVGIAITTPEMTAFAENTHKNGIMDKQSETEVRAVQEFLHEKGHLKEEQVTAEWDAASTQAVRDFQTAHRAAQIEEGVEKSQLMSIDGGVGKEFRSAMNEDYLNNLSADDLSKVVQTEIDQRTEGKEVAIDKINEEVKASEMNISQLSGEQQTLLTNQIALQEQAKEDIAKQIDGVDRQINTIETAQRFVNEPPLDSENSLYSQMKGCIANGDRLLLTDAEQALADKGSIDPSNKEEVKVLQAVFHERGLLEAKEVMGSFGPKTQEHLAESLGLDKSTAFDKKIMLRIAV